MGHGSKLQFEGDSIISSLKGVPNGEMNHSGVCVANLTPIFAKLIDSQLQRCLSTNLLATKWPPSFTFIANEIYHMNGEVYYLLIFQMWQMSGTFGVTSLL